MFDGITWREEEEEESEGVDVAEDSERRLGVEEEIAWNVFVAEGYMRIAERFGDI
jgi:hypothetical protein